MKASRIICSFLIAVSVIAQAHAATTPPCVKELKRLEKAVTKAERSVTSKDNKLFRMEAAVSRAEIKMAAKILKYQLNEEAFKQARLFFVGSCALMLLIPKEICTQIPKYQTVVYENADGTYGIEEEQVGTTSQCAETKQSCLAKVLFNEGKLASLGGQRKAAEKSEARKVASVKKRETRAQADLNAAKAAYDKAKAIYDSKSALCQG